MQDPKKEHQRRSIRIKGYDYAAPGAYFVTVVAQARRCLFGKVIGGEMVCNTAGQMINKTWSLLPEKYPNINVDIFQLMPNHFHGIIIINELNDNVGATLVVAQKMEAHHVRAGTRPAPTVGEIVGAFKSITTHEYIQGVHAQAWSPFSKRLWQRNYYEHILRNRADLENTANYICPIHPCGTMTPRTPAVIRR